MTVAWMRGMTCSGSWAGMSPWSMASVRIEESIWATSAPWALRRPAVPRETAPDRGPEVGKWKCRAMRACWRT